MKRRALLALPLLGCTMSVVPSLSPYANPITNAMVNNSGLFTPLGTPPNDYVKHDFAASYSISTRDTSLALDVVPTSSAGTGFPTGLAVYVNGAFFTRISVVGTLGVKQTVTVTLPGGPKTVVIEEWCTYVTSIACTSSPSLAAPLHSLDCWGDSIVDGIAALDFVGSWVVLLRHATAYYGNVTMHGVGGSTLSAWTPSTYAAAIVARATGTLTQEVYNEMGTNDFDVGSNMGTMSPASWATLMGQCIDAALASKPTLKFWQQTLILRPGQEGVPNANFGATPEDYRVAQRSVAVGRPAVTIIEGPPLCDSSQIANPHPNGTGHAQIAARVMPLLNN
jgi:hypothetical protein